jgi:RNA polymerase sigma-70 factor, ECF subfamily
LDSAEKTISDKELVSRVRSGDQNAMGAVYDRYSSLVYAVALRVLADGAAAEDALQEVFMQLWRNPARFDANRGSLRAWLAVIARNRAIDVLRKRHLEIGY